MKRENIYQLHAEICKTLSNANRLQIIEQLGLGEASASQLLGILKINKVTLSQSMNLLTRLGIAISQRRGKNVVYQLADKRIMKAFGLMREVLISRLTKQNQLLKKMSGGTKS